MKDTKSLRQERKKQTKEYTVTYYYITSSFEELEKNDFDYSKVRFNTFERIERKS